MAKGKILACTIAITFHVALLLGGCGESAPMTLEVKEAEGYTGGQIMLVVATEKNRYSEVYSDQVWQIPIDQEGTTFQEYLLKQVRHFLEEVKVMNLMADQQEIVLTNQEQERLEELTKDFYESLTEADLAYIGVSQEEVLQLYSEYYRAGRLVEELTKDVDLEISDSEAKVIVVQEIQVNDHEEAQKIHTQAMTEGVDFASLARVVTQGEQVQKMVGRKERSQEYEDVVFKLAEGEIGPIIREGDHFFIVKCIEDYDEEATLDRKQNLSLERKTRVFRKAFDAFAAHYTVNMGGEIWNQISLGEAESSSTTDFFEWYADYME